MEMPEEWFEINGYLKIGDNGMVTIMSPNPEGGQNVKTSMPMIVADEFDVDWKDVIVEQAPLNTELFNRQFIGGSQAIRQGWNGLRMAGASARHMLKEAAAMAWMVPVAEITTDTWARFSTNQAKNQLPMEKWLRCSTTSVPEKVMLKDIKDFSIIGTSKKNVDGLNIIKVSLCLDPTFIKRECIQP